METSYSEQLLKLISDTGINHGTAAHITVLILVAIALGLAVLLDKILQKIGLRIFQKAVKRTKTNWDDILGSNKFFSRLIHLIPAFLLQAFSEPIFEVDPKMEQLYSSTINIYVLILIILIINSFLKSVNDIYMSYPGSKNRPIKGYIQTIQIILVFLGVITIFSIVAGKPLLVTLGGLGAFAAVLMLIFKDSILGFVAGIQISFNDMVRLGDWVSIPKYGADGTVIDIALTTVKIQNWDKTISTVPSYALITDSFQNWRGMEESGGRRIKRSVYINMNSVKFADEKLLNKLSKIQLISDYIDRKEAELKKYNEEKGFDSSVVVNGRRQTNLGIFRAYLEAYLKSKEEIHNDMTFIVRQLQPTEHGIPMEIYVFSKIQSWVEYEAIQSDIFDHVLAAIPEFELEVFQNPSGKDFRTSLNPIKN